MIDARAIEAAAMKRAIKAARSMMRPFVPPNNETLAKALTAAAPFLTQIPDGWKLVPIKATDEMADRAFHANLEDYEHDALGYFHDMWDEMIAAAPLPPPTEKNDD